MVLLRMYYLKLAAIVLLLSACQQREWFKKEFSQQEKLDLSEQLLNGRGYYYQGSVPEQFVLDEALMMNPNNADVWREKGVAWLKRGFGADMNPFYAKAVELDAEKWSGMRGYIYLYFYRDYGRAIADFNATDTLTEDFIDHPQGQSVDYMRGICYYGLTDYNKAIAYLNKYVESVIIKEGEAWADPYAVLYRGLTFEKLGQDERAIEEFDRVIRIYPNVSDPFYHKARIFAKNGNYHEALQLVGTAKNYFEKGYSHQRPYVEVLEQIYMVDIEELEKEIREAASGKNIINF